eukprot:gene707-27288_t
MADVPCSAATQGAAWARDAAARTGMRIPPHGHDQ